MARRIDQADLDIVKALHTGETPLSKEQISNRLHMSRQTVDFAVSSGYDLETYQAQRFVQLPANKKDVNSDYQAGDSVGTADFVPSVETQLDRIERLVGEVVTSVSKLEREASKKRGLFN